MLGVIAKRYVARLSGKTLAHSALQSALASIRPGHSHKNDVHEDAVRLHVHPRTGCCAHRYYKQAFCGWYSGVCSSPGRTVFAKDSQDNQHLLGVSPSFAAQADLELCAGKQAKRLGFLGDSAVISGHSPVLSPMVEEVQSHSQRQEASQPTVPMVDESSTAVHALLEHIYQPFHLENSEEGNKTDTAALSMDTAGAMLDTASLAHHYGMTKVLSGQEQGFMILLQSLLVQPTGNLSKDEHSFVLKCASVADQYKLSAISEFCEGVTALHFTSFSHEEHAMGSTLSSASMLTIDQIRDKLQTGTTEAVYQALQSHIKATEDQVASSSQFTIQHGGLATTDQLNCPM